MNTLKLLRRSLVPIFAFITLLGALILTPVFAQESTPEPTGAAITFSGTITAVDSGVIVVNGLTVSIENVALNFTPQPGQTVTVNGSLLPDGRIIAVTVVIIVAESTPEATAAPESTPEATPEATAAPDDDDTTGVIIVIEGPVQQINVNVITIYNINVIVDPNDPILVVVQIGDIIRVEGELVDDDDDDDGGSIVIIGGDVSVTIIAITIVIVDVDVVINPDDGQAWRDPGDCGNPPPPWAPAHGWRRRCEGSGNSGGGGGGRGNDDDDDDDD